MSGAYYDRMARLDKFTRTLRTTVTYLKKAQHWLHNDPPNITEYWGLLDLTIETATEIIERLPDDFFESGEVEDFFGIRASLGLESTAYNSSDEPLEAAKKLVELIEKRRERGALLTRIMRLEAIKGRTPEEAEAYLSKARQLRQRLRR